MLKKISEEQIKAILDLLIKYNVGVQEYSGVMKLFQELPKIEVEEKEKTEKAEKASK